VPAIPARRNIRLSAVSANSACAGSPRMATSARYA